MKKMVSRLKTKGQSWVSNKSTELHKSRDREVRKWLSKNRKWSIGPSATEESRKVRILRMVPKID